jgi:hypothetical protein
MTSRTLRVAAMGPSYLIEGTRRTFGGLTNQ